jgi:iron-sulfur cluster assembly accessory protein
MSKVQFTTQLTDEIKISYTAAKQLAMIAKQGNSLGIRLYLEGGAKGITLGMTVVSEQETHDSIYEKNQLKVFIDPITLSLIRGLEIGFVNETQGSGFRFSNIEFIAPPAQAGGCGFK